MSGNWKEAEGRVFVDTNILFYAFDHDAERKHDYASEIVDVFFEDDRGVISVQVLQELTVNLRKRLPDEERNEQLSEIIDAFRTWRVIRPEGQDVLRAHELADRYTFSFWDGMIVHTARVAGVDWLLTEDMQHGQELVGLTVVNPFRGE